MRLFRSDRPPVAGRPVPELLRALERDDFRAAVEAFRARGPRDPLPPPHALWRLGRGLLEAGDARRAIDALGLLVESYPAHGDAPAAQRDLARALLAAGKRKRAAALLRALEA